MREYLQNLEHNELDGHKPKLCLRAQEMWTMYSSGRYREADRMPDSLVLCKSISNLIFGLEGSTLLKLCSARVGMGPRAPTLNRAALPVIIRNAPAVESPKTRDMSPTKFWSDDITLTICTSSSYYGLSDKPVKLIA